MNSAFMRARGLLGQASASKRIEVNRSIQRRKTMKKLHLSTALVALTLLLAVGPAFSQSNLVLTQVPFDFVVGTTLFPSGEYGIRSNGMASAAFVIYGKAHSPMFFLPNVATSNQAAKRSKLVFRKYGNRYFLHEIWIEGQTRGRAMPPSHVERELARSHAPDSIELALK
jgi:hypothetical protein